MNNELIMKMMAFEEGNPCRVHHFLKVYTFAKIIGEMEEIPAEKQFILETAAIVHDIGIKLSLEKYGDSIGPHQEALGAPAAEKLLTEMHYDPAVVKRVSFLVGHHHTYDQVDDIDYQILLEADALVNLYENHTDNKAAAAWRKNVFKTKAGTGMLNKIFMPDQELIFDEKHTA